MTNPLLNSSSSSSSSSNSSRASYSESTLIYKDIRKPNMYSAAATTTQTRSTSSSDKNFNGGRSVIPSMMKNTETYLFYEAVHHLCNTSMRCISSSSWDKIVLCLERVRMILYEDFTQLSNKPVLSLILDLMDQYIQVMFSN